MNKKNLVQIFSRYQKHNPHPTTELVYRSKFELLISVILSAQATDISVNKATKSLFKKANTPKKMAALGVEELKSYIKSIGLFNTKAANIIKTCHLLCEEHKGRIPRTRQDLEKLPGVGRKTANVILNTAFGEPTIAVDTHIFRVSNRTGIAPGKTPLKVEESLLKNIPDEFKLHAHHWLILHGRYVCLARKPQCERCMINDLCDWRIKQQKGRPKQVL
ncbi:MAG: endonuclease III [Candidatus Oxydemutatoraceae bacterium WSBS_2016_MAG_OTU14]